MNSRFSLTHTFATLALFLTLGLSFGSFAQPVLDLQLDDSRSISVTENALDCNTLLSLPVAGRPAIKDNFGIPIAKGNPEDFSLALTEVLKTKTHSEIIGSRIYVTGIEMGDEKALRVKYDEVLKNHGFAKGDVTVHLHSFPRSLLREDFKVIWKEIHRDLSERLKFFLLGSERDFQMPTAAEAAWGVVDQLGTEIPVMVLISKDLAPQDAATLFAVNTVYLGLYGIFSKTITNWTIRVGTGPIERLVKNVLTSVPTILTYHAVTAGAGIEGDFLKTQAFNVGLHILFNEIVINRGFGAWNNAQAKIASDSSRSFTQLMQLPFYTADALLLGIGATQLPSLVDVGNFIHINEANLAFVGLTIAGALLTRTQVLDRLHALYLPLYLKSTQRLNAFARYLESKGMHPRQVFKNKKRQKATSASVDPDLQEVEQVHP